MSEIKTYVCPNCGASTTNTQNCEYCGSLLVRFVEKGLDLSHTSYTSNDTVFPGLIEELRRNLKLQEDNPNIWVATDLTKVVKCEDVELKSSISVMSSFIWNDGTEPESLVSDKIQLCIFLDFCTFTDIESDSYEEFNKKMDEELAIFRQLDSFPLFTPHNGTFIDDNGRARYGREYAVNFGRDAEGAARLVSEILIRVYGWSPTEPYDIFTNVGDDNVERARVEWDEAHGFSSDQQSMDDTEQSMENNSGCMILIVALIATVGSLMCECFV